MNGTASGGGAKIGSGSDVTDAERTIGRMTRIEELRFRTGDASLAGSLTLPEVDGRLPWVLLVPSWLPRGRNGGWDRVGHPSWFATPSSGAPPGLLTRLADAFAAGGVATLRYDPRGCGASDGAWERVDLFTRIDDARDAIGAMRSRPELDLRRAAIVGHGEGAGIALSVAIGDPAIGAVGLIGASARSLRDVLRRGAAERERTRTDREHPIVAGLDRNLEELVERADRRELEMTLPTSAGQVELNLAAWEQGIHTPTLALATMLHRNAVLAHGTGDAWTDPDESRLLADALREAGNTPDLQLLDGAGHDLDEADDAAISTFADAVIARMEPRDLPPVLLAIEEMQG